MSIKSEILRQKLKENFRFDYFRDGQEDIINSVLSGNDTLAVMPTGSGKSLCYQLPSIMMEGTAIVVSPLIALMKDQVDSMSQKGIRATFVNSSLGYDVIRYRLSEVIEGKYKLLYLAPERFESKEFHDFLSISNLSFLAVDEAHCISEWGHDFRPSYLSIIQTIEKIRKIQVLALTATATPEVQDDIVKSLKMKAPQKFIRGFDRPNLSYLVEKPADKLSRLAEVCSSVQDGSVIVYCGSRKRVENYSAGLATMGFKPLMYHAGFLPEIRKKTQETFMSGNNNIIFATNAFGMGIDKSDVREIIHLDITQTLEAYYQEAGRAGRDGNSANCRIFYHPQDRKLQDFFIETSYPSIENIISAYETIYDLKNAKIGEKPSDILITDEVQLANMLSINVSAMNSIIKLFAKHEILKQSNNNGTATIRFITNKERIAEYFNNLNGKNKYALEAILRTVSSEAFYNDVEFDITKMSYKHNVSSDDVMALLKTMEFARLIKYSTILKGQGIIFYMERMPFGNLPINFDDFYNLKERAIKKLDLVIRYIETRACKRNFILSYFGENDITESCGSCSSCLEHSSKPKIMDSKMQFALHELLLTISFINGRFGKRVLLDIVQGKNIGKVKLYNLSRLQTFGSCKEFNTAYLTEQIDSAIQDGYIVVSADAYPTLSITELALKVIKSIPEKVELKLPQKPHDSNKIYDELKKLRDELALIERCSPNDIIDDRGLRILAGQVPVNIKDMKVLPSVTDNFVRRFGKTFIAKISEILSKDGFKKNRDLSSQKLNSLQAKILNDIEKGSSLNLIAKQNKLTKAELSLIISEIAETGIKFRTDKILNNDVLELVAQYLKYHPKSTLKDVRRELKVDIDFPELRIAVAVVRSY